MIFKGYAATEAGGELKPFEYEQGALGLMKFRSKFSIVEFVTAI